MSNAYSTIFRNRNFMKIWAAQICSLTSAFILIFVLIDSIFSQTGSTIAVGMLMFCYYLPIIFVGPWTGILVDRLDKRKIIKMVTLAQAALALLLLFSGSRVWLAFSVILLYSLGDAVFNPSVGASLPVVVKRRQLITANGLFLFTSQGTIALGSLLGGILLKFLGRPQLVFLLIALLLSLSSFWAGSLPKNMLASKNRLKLDFADLNTFREALKLDSLWLQLKEAYLFTRSETFVLIPILMLSALQGIVSMALAILPALSSYLNINFTDSSYLLIAPTIFGALFGNILLTKISRLTRKKNFIFFGLFTLPFVLMAIAVIPFVLQNPLISVLPLGFSLGISFAFIAIPLQTLLQENTPFRIRGRIYALLWSAMLMAGLVPMFVTVTLIDLLGVRAILLVESCLLLFGAIVSWRKQNLIWSFNHAKG